MELYPDGYAYSQYCYHLQRFLCKKDVVMHLEYKPGEQTMIDLAGKKYHWVDQQTGELVSCEVFVATLPFSGLIFCMALPENESIFVHLLKRNNLFWIMSNSVTEVLLRF